MIINEYPYTDFHELNLDWFLAQFKTLTDVWDAQKVDYEQFKTAVTGEFNTLSGKFDTLEETVQSFTTFITNYFDNLDVQDEINTKLNEMVSDGTMTELIRPIFDAYSAQMTQRMNVLEGRMDEFASLPEGSTSGDAELADIRVGGNGVTYPTAGDAVRAQYNINHNAISELAKYPNLADPALFTEGYYMASDGVRSASTYHFYTAKIPVEVGQVIKANHIARFITAYSGNTAVPEKGVNDPTGWDRPIIYTVPEGIDGLIFTFANEYAVDLMIYVYDGIEYEYIPYGKIAYINPDILPNQLKIINTKESRPVYKEISGTEFPANTFISLPVFSCTRKNTRLIYRAFITSLGNFEIGFTTAANSGGTKYNRFVITSTSVIAYLSYNYQTQTMDSVIVMHNLNIAAGSLQIIIEEHPNATCTITIENNGNTFKHVFEEYYFKSTILQPYCYSADGTFSDYKFTWSCTDLDKKIWIFGDSYMSYSNARWPYYLEEYGYAKNALFNSYPGCSSGAAMTSLNNLINYGNPKYIVWAMGMNDGSDSESAPSTSWVNNRDAFIAVCEENSIEPIFCTIPTVPTVNNEQKNAWIRSSGYRYIDFAKAVNASASGVWLNGTLSSDNVHPTINGARALYAEFVLDFPEIMQGLDGTYPSNT